MIKFRIKKIDLLLLLLGVILSLLFFLLSQSYESQKKLIATDKKFNFPIWSMAGSAETLPPRLLDFYRISKALEAYKVEHERYPMSAGDGTEWGTLYNHKGVYDPEWIKELSPKYIKVLPRDPRNDASYEHQYSYKSDGANYKLIARYPEDCKEVIKVIPATFDDRIKGCNYGLWTINARKWR